MPNRYKFASKTMNKRKINIITTIIITSFMLVFYLLLEIHFYNDIECSCVVSYYPMMTSRIVGYFLLIFSTALFVASVWKIKKLSRWWTIPALIVFGIAFYGNGYALYSMSCTPSINKTTFFVHKNKLGDFTQPINTDSLRTGKYDGKLLGYSIAEKELTLYRIGESPLKVKTSFLFWKVRPSIIVHTLSPILHSHRNLEFENNNNGYEFIGGQDMPVEIFLNEIVYEKNEFAGKKLINQKIINETDGTTRFQFETKKNKNTKLTLKVPLRWI